MANKNVVEVIISAKDQATGVFNSLTAKLSAVATAVAGYFGVSLFSSAVKGAADLEAGMSRIQAASGATAQELAALKKAAEDAGASTKFTATEAASALENLVKSGLSAKDAIASLPAVLNLAQAGDVGLAEASSFLTQAIKGLGLEFKDAARVADVLAQSANASSTSVAGLAAALSYAAPVANAAKLSLEDTVAILGKFADGGIDASRAGTALNAILSQFIDPASKFRQELATAGIVTSDFNVALRQLAAAGPKGQQAILAVGTEAGPALRALLNQGIGALDELKLKLDDAAGSAAKAAALMEGNLNGAFGGLSSAWDSFKIALAEPVLPVLTDAVKQLTAGISAAVSNGTIGQFGTTIATAFKSAIEWVNGFVAAVDFKVVAAQLQEFAAKTGETLTRLGQQASNAGDFIKLAYGVMSAGANTVLAGIYALGSGFAGVAAGIQTGLALLYEGFAKITFGGLSQQYKAIAAEIRESANATAASAQALGEKSSQAFEAAAKSGELAQTAYRALSTAADTSTAAQVSSAAAIQNVAAQLEAMGDQAPVAAQKQIEGATKTREAVAQLKQEYEAAMAAGDIQLAAQKQQLLRDELSKTSGQAKVTKEALQSAFESLGIVSQAKLKESADGAQRLFDILKASGQATALDLKNAFAVVAQRTVDAAGAIGSTARSAAEATLKAKAGAEGLSLEFDAAGKVIVRAMGEGSKAVDGVTNSVVTSTEAIKAQEEAYDRLLMRYKLRADYTERQIALEEKDIALQERRDSLERKRLKIDKEGLATGKDGQRIVAGSDISTLTGIAAFLKAAGVSEDAAARKMALEFSDGRGNIPYIGNAGQKKYGGESSTLSFALLKAAETYTFGSGSKAASQPSSIPAQTQSASSTHVIKYQAQNGQTTSFNAASAEDASTAAELIKRLAQAKSAAGY